MLPWKLLDTVAPASGIEEMRLYQRGNEFSIRVANYELMTSNVHASEDALASAACERLRNMGTARVLVGGLGMGYTLAEVLKHVGRGAHVEVAELVPAVVAWNRGPLADLAGRPLDDPRVAVLESDVAAVIRERTASWDAILLDVDNGPAALTAESNSRLYSEQGLRASLRALRAGGILGIWSSGEDARFTRRLEKAGFAVEELRPRGSSRTKGPRYHLWIARKA